MLELDSLAVLPSAVSPGRIRRLRPGRGRGLPRPFSLSRAPNGHHLPVVLAWPDVRGIPTRSIGEMGLNNFSNSVCTTDELARLYIHLYI